LISRSFKDKSPKISRACFVAENATLVGDIALGEQSSLWYGVAIRAEGGPVRIGRGVNIQDNSVVHVDPGGRCVIGDGVSVGHGAIIHGAMVGENTLIGMGSILLNNCVVGRNCVVGAGSLITQGTEIPEGSLVLGSPASVKRRLSPEEILGIKRNADNYDELRIEYLGGKQS
jgi:carbonic anhydrase/acetyltransferase-like protein (isoleucine patch superfamily)